MRTIHLRIQPAVFLLLVLGMVSLTACSGNEAPTGSGGVAGVAVKGTVTGPGGAIAKIPPTSKSWFASLFQVAEAFAQQVTGWTAVPNATVRVFRIDSDGNPVGTTLIAPVTTAADGSFSLTLPTGTVFDSTLVAQVENDPGITDPAAVGTPNTYSAFVVASTITLNPAVEVVTRAIVADPAPLSNFTNSEITQVYSGISNLIAQNPPAPPVDANAVTANFGATITDAVNATSGATAGVPVILTITLPNGTAGTAYATALVAVGGTGTLTWSLDPTSAPLPAGIILATNGQLSGTPQQNGLFSIKFRVTDGTNPATADLILTLAPAAAPSITTTSPLPNGVINQAYSRTFAATGGTGALSWTITAGTLPSGLTLSLGGILSGTPALGSEGTHPISVTVTDSSTPVAQTETKAFDLTITAAPQPPTITTTSLPNGTVNTAYNQSLAATGGTPPYAWSILSGSVAPLSLSAAGVISGTPTAAKTVTFTVRVKDANNLTAQQTLSVTINPAGGGGGADIDVANATPTSGNTNISGPGVTVTTTFDTLNGVPVTRVQVDGTSGGMKRQVQVYFATGSGTVQAVNYSWGTTNLNENIVYCPAAGCTGVSINTTTKEIFFTNTALDNHGPVPPTTKFATISLGGIQYP